MTQGQTWNPEVYAKNARYVADYLGQPVLELLNPQPGERILDLGCGDGALTLKLIEIGCEAVGVDSSAEQIEAARKLGLNAHRMNAAELPFEQEFDAVFSNAALHWMKNPDPVIAGVWRALKPDGRFVAECGGFGNVSCIRNAIYDWFKKNGLNADEYDPWYFPSVEDYRGRLEKQGFHVASIELIPRPVQLPGNTADWLETFALSFIRALPEQDRPRFLEEVKEATRPELYYAGHWHVDYIRLRLCAFAGHS